MYCDSSNITLDDTGRVALPRQLRGVFEEDKVVLTWGADTSLWLFAMGEWKAMEALLIENRNPFSPPERIMRQLFIGSKREIEIDKQGRILIPPTHRDYADMSKDCIIFGIDEHIEIWDKGSYKAHLEANKPDFNIGLERLGARIMEQKELKNGTDSPHSGSAGRDAGIPGSEGKG